MKRLIKIVTASVLGLTLLAGVSFTTAKPVEAAVTSGWTHLVSHTYAPNPTSTYWRILFDSSTKRIISKGGLIKAEPGYLAGPVTITMYEKDNGDSYSYVGEYTLKSNTAKTIDVEKWVDGTNKEAELFVYYQGGAGFTKPFTIKWYD